MSDFDCPSDRRPSPLDHSIPPEGSRLGHYRLDKEIGRGGQGIVYLATDTRIGRRVARKVVRGAGPDAHEMLQRFMREARAASRSDHPGVCAVYDAEIEHGVPYIAMRFVEGETLARRLAGRTEPGGSTGNATIGLLTPDPVTQGEAGSGLPPPPAYDVSWILGVVEKAARALHSVHEAGVIHRDIKPGNIMVTPCDDVVLLDFGLARDTDSDRTLTQTGDLLGTPSYMSPEQLSRGTLGIDHRTDIWSLGATLYECLTFRRPFEGPTRQALYQAILTREPADPRRLNPRLSRDLATVVLCCLEKDRDRRYATAEALADDLASVQGGRPVAARPVVPVQAYAAPLAQTGAILTNVWEARLRE